MSKQEVRQRLAFVSAHYPAARPSRGNIKEVFNFARVYLAGRELEHREHGPDEGV